MINSTSVKGVLIATTVAALFGCAESAQRQAAVPSGEGGTVKCSGINSCKGQGTCATADHSCGKHTPCKGQGWLSVSPEECAAKGGKVL